jgi:hypothetical protein
MYRHALYVVAPFTAVRGHRVSRNRRPLSCLQTAVTQARNACELYADTRPVAAVCDLYSAAIRILPLRIGCHFMCCTLTTYPKPFDGYLHFVPTERPIARRCTSRHTCATPRVLCVRFENEDPDRTIAPFRLRPSLGPNLGKSGRESAAAILAAFSTWCATGAHRYLSRTPANYISPCSRRMATTGDQRTVSTAPRYGWPS